jgi:hypothetical protein
VSTKRGAPRKAPGGLGRVLYVRVDDPLLEALDRRQQELTRETGVTWSRADVVRQILNNVLQPQESP